MIIEPNHYAFLSIQRGDIKDFKPDRKAWNAAYARVLLETYSSIHPVLPEKCANVLDIGGGMGGIDLLLTRRYRGLDVTILDGLDTAAEVHTYHEPFNSATVTEDFHRKNGNDKITTCFPRPNPPQKFDLIISFAAYCFHILPCDYMDVVKASMHKDTILIFDVRRQRADWLAEVTQAWGKPVLLKQEQKYVRLAFNCPPEVAKAAAI